MSTLRPAVLLVHSFDAYAGAQRIGHAIVTGLSRAGVDVSVRLGFGGRGFLSELPGVTPDVSCNHIPTRKLLYPLWALAALWPIAWAAARGRTIWVNAIYAIVPAFLAILLFPERTVVHLHEATFPRPFRLLLRLAEWRGSTIVCVSADQARRIGVPAEILPNPVELPACDPISAADRLLFIGTTQPIKGFALFIAVCKRLGPVTLRKTAYLSDEDRYDPTLVADARSAGIDVIFGERSPDVMYADGYLVLLCTDPQLWVETFSLVAAESVAWLVPVAGTGTTVLPEVLGDALAFDEPNREPDRIAQAIADLHNNPDRYAALRAACYARRPQFSEETFADRIAHLLSRTETE